MLYTPTPSWMKEFSGTWLHRRSSGYVLCSVILGFFEDQVVHNGMCDEKLLLDPASFVLLFSLIGSINVGIHHIVANDWCVDVI
ncbi:hypothetical protein GSI_08378 [Ganoderma sinense ZZ0214-1]|uniref:Uncharacterized protein n=1 Tax=Ganoderma sinense ZZ0214-1 TaxID=1077348 RepID=A0A2G8S6N0_9APHY|nr:hypothetical protein GSI_08378 [Ganoderma sinense ZZ0214-1]